MLGLETLDVAIGLIFVYLLVSILCAAIREAIEAVMKTRGAYLWLGIRELLNEKNAPALVSNFYRHPMIHSLFAGDFEKMPLLQKPDFLARSNGVPSYIPSRNFALALMDLAARGPSDRASDGSAPVISLENIRANITEIQNPAVQRVLLTAVDSAQGDLNQAQATIEAWYDSAMDRVSGWYKRTTQFWLFGIGLFVAVSMNINSVVIVDHLYRTPAAREAIVKRADAYLKQAAATKDADQRTVEKYETAEKSLKELNLPIGWDRGWRSPTREASGGWRFWNIFLVPVLGWLATAFAATLGAPFWFDLLNKIMVIRSTVKPHEKSPEEASEDRQKKPAAPAPPPPAPIPPAPPPAAPPAPQAAPPARDIEWDTDGCTALQL